MKLTVQAISKYGVLHEDKWFNMGPGLKPEMFVKGVSYEVETEQGSRGVLLLKATPLAGEAPKPVAAQAAFKKSFTSRAKPSDGLSKEEWASKDLRISRQGVIQAAVQAMAPLVANRAELFPEAEKLAVLMLEFVNKK